MHVQSYLSKLACKAIKKNEWEIFLVKESIVQTPGFLFHGIGIFENKLKVTSGRQEYIFPQKIVKALRLCQST